jgi:hypothetical protein
VTEAEIICAYLWASRSVVERTQAAAISQPKNNRVGQTGGFNRLVCPPDSSCVWRFALLAGAEILTDTKQSHPPNSGFTSFVWRLDSSCRWRNPVSHSDKTIALGKRKA